MFISVGTGDLFFSAYGRRALLAVDDTLYMIGLNSRELESHDISGQELAGAELAGWTDSLNDEVLFVRREPAGQSGLDARPVGLPLGHVAGHVATDR